MGFMGWSALGVLLLLASVCNGVERIHGFEDDSGRRLSVTQQLRIHHDPDGGRDGPDAARHAIAAGREPDSGNSGFALGSDAGLRSELVWTRHGGRVVSGLGRRKALQVPDNSSRPLAVRGDRPDPFNKLKKYRGGFDVENKHYWASVVFTGITLASLGVLWIILGIAAICWRKRLLRRRVVARGAPAVHGWGPLFLAGAGFLISIALFGLLVHFNMTFQKDMRKVEDIIYNTTETATQAVADVISHLFSLMQVNTTSLGISLEEDYGDISDLTDINKEAASVQHKVSQFLKIMRRVLKPLNITLYFISATEVALLALGLVLAVILFRFRRVGHALLWVTLICWLFTILVWASSAIYLVADNVAVDVCTALKEYQQHPESTTLEPIIPCRKLQRVSVKGLGQLQEQLGAIVWDINDSFGTAQNNSGIDFGPNFPTVCNPFANANDSALSLTTMTASCPPNSIPIGSLPEALAPFVCHDRDPIACTVRLQVVTPEQYNATVLLCSGLQTLVADDVPAIQVLANCSFVLDAFSAIQQQCPPVKAALRSIWILFLTVALTPALAIVGWLLVVRRNHGVPRRGSVNSVDPNATEISQPGKP